MSDAISNALGMTQKLASTQLCAKQSAGRQRSSVLNAISGC